MKAKLKSTHASNWGGGESHSNLLKSHYKKSLFTLIKSAKRYYLGIWLIKLPFYAIFSKSKAKKYREKRTIRYENLQIAKKRFKGICKLSPQIKVWIESKEFKEKYTNHPYPPLLNPKNIDYKSISAELAWEMNLPLPPYYDLIYFNNGATASMHILQFFKHCGLKVIPHWEGIVVLDFREKYTLNYAMLLENKNYFNVIAVCVFTAQSDKFFYLLPKSTPLFYVARDPISRMKSKCNHDAGVDTPLNCKFLTLANTDFKNLFPKTKYWTKNGPIDIPQVKSAFDEPSLYHTICFDGFLYKMPHLGQKYIFSFESFAPNRTFETFKKIAKIFNLNMPNDERLFSTRAEKARFGLGVLPVILEHNGVQIHISADCSVRKRSKIEILTEAVMGGGRNITLSTTQRLSSMRTKRRI